MEEEITYEQVSQALAEFIVRVSQGNATPEETAILPEVAKMVLDIQSFS